MPLFAKDVAPIFPGFPRGCYRRAARSRERIYRRQLSQAPTGGWDCNAEREQRGRKRAVNISFAGVTRIVLSVDSLILSLRSGFATTIGYLAKINRELCRRVAAPRGGRLTSRRDLFPDR